MQMQQLKPWQIVLFVLAIAALSFGIFKSCSGQNLDLANSIVMVDVETGELFSFDIGGKRGVGVPNFNPDSGKLSLLPVTKDETGTWRLTDRAKPIVKDLEVKASAIVDIDTGEVTTVGSPKKVRK